MSVTIRYPLVKRANLSHAQLAESFGFKTVATFRSSSAHHRYMNAVEAILRLLEQKKLEEIRIIISKSQKHIFNLILLKFQRSVL